MICSAFSVTFLYLTFSIKLFHVQVLQKLKAQVNNSDKKMPVVRRRWRCRKLFTFSTHLATMHPWVKGIQVC